MTKEALLKMNNKFISKAVIFSASFIVILIVFFINSKTVKITAGSENIVLHRTLNFKDTGDDVKVLQNLLSDLKLNIGEDEDYGNFEINTLSAVKAIQRYSNITVDGQVGNDTVDNIHSLVKSQTPDLLEELKSYQDEYILMYLNSKNIDKIYSDNDNYILFKGTEDTILRSRNENTPQLILNHTSNIETFENVDARYINSENTVNSSHFVIDTDGNIYQYVDIKYAALFTDTSFYNDSRIDSTFVKSTDLPINDYSIQIMNISRDSTLTDEQLKSSIWLHNYIIKKVREIYGINIPVDRSHIIGHADLDRFGIIESANSNFPWVELINNLKSN
jgi:N-acetyl-anhydromuramyl-L-alanine amidase AmpD